MVRLGRRGSLPDRPDGLVGDDDPVEVGAGELSEAALELGRDHRSGGIRRPGRSLADTDDRDEVPAQRRPDLGRDDRIGLAVIAASLGVADLDVAAAEIDEHRGGHVAGVGAAIFRMDVLAAVADR